MEGLMGARLLGSWMTGSQNEHGKNLRPCLRPCDILANTGKGRKGRKGRKRSLFLYFTLWLKVKEIKERGGGGERETSIKGRKICDFADFCDP